MKNSIFFILLIFTIQTHCQTFSGTIIYNVKVINYEEKSENVKIRSLSSKMIEKANKQSFKLEFNKNKSSFSRDESLYIDNESSIDKLISSIITTSDSYYFDGNNQKYILKKNDGILINQDFKLLDWEITTEAKKIDSYLCYKAIYIKNYVGRDGLEKNVAVIAWFAPSLPYNYGPKEYNGLPGLILELHENKANYYASNISIHKDKELEIDVPESNRITQEEYVNRVLSN